MDGDEDEGLILVFLGNDQRFGLEITCGWLFYIKLVRMCWEGEHVSMLGQV